MPISNAGHFNAVSEWFFWNEFSSRYNFIAVDYLVYTNEVIGNIVESYPIVPIVLGVLLVSVLVTILVRRKLLLSVNVPVPAGRRFMVAGVMSFLLLAMAYLLPANLHNFTRNNFANELAGNGMYSFVQAFKNNELSFYKYYETIPDDEAFKIMHEELTVPHSRFISPENTNLLREISDSLPENKMNIVLISVESLSAQYLEQFGDPYGLTPYLNNLSEKGMSFTRLYASGTRTVRGLEAISLAIPPLPGQSLVKRKNNEQMFSLGAVLKSQGYTTQYLYGGYSYFDNMKGFFGQNNYEVIDRDSIPPALVHYSNIWGVADEDLFTLATKKMDENSSKNKPFFAHIMTVSNHRPYT
ncbi:MAG: LTA synthase family protein, partial [Chitinophagaceae bacterium]